MTRCDIKVSIVTPTYNDEKYIKNTIECVLKQTHANFELIIVDDHSTDKTVDVINSFNDDRILLLKNESNSGAAFSRNRALSIATGDYIAFLDGDDLWAPDKLEKQLDFMIYNNYLFSCTDYYVIDEEGNKTGWYVTGPKKMTHRTFLRCDYIGCLTAMYKREICPNLQIPNDIIKRNDYALWLLLSEKTKCYYLKEKLAYYRKRTKGSISSGKKTGLIKYHKFLFQNLYGFSKFKSAFYAYRNVLFYFWKKLFYVRKCKK